MWFKVRKLTAQSGKVWASKNFGVKVSTPIHSPKKRLPGGSVIWLVEYSGSPMAGVKQLLRFPFRFHVTSLTSKLHLLKTSVLREQQALPVSACYVGATDIISDVS